MKKRGSVCVKYKRKNLLHSALDTVGLPSESIGNQARILLCGREELQAKPCRALQKYTQTEVCVRLSDGALRILGSGLNIRTFLDGELILRGKIDSVDLCEERERGEAT